MNHSPFYRKQPKADTAVLLIHGILSTPRHFDFLIPHIPTEYSVYNILLTGHGGSVADFSKASMMQWKDQIASILTELEAQYDRIFVIGHSLGSLLALHAYQTHNAISGLILLNTPLSPKLPLTMMGRSLRFAFGNVHTDDPNDVLCYQDLGILLEPYLWKYIPWIPNFISLLRLAHKCRSLTSKLQCPCYVFLGHKDELVRISSRRWLQNNSNIILEEFENGTHFGYSPEEQAQIIHTFQVLTGRMIKC